MKKLRREFHSRSKAFACLLTMCAGFSDAYTFIERGGTLAAGQTGNVVFLSVGLIGHEIADVEVKLATMLAFMIGIFLMTVFQRFFSHSVWRLSTLVPFVLTTLVAGFLPKESAQCSNCTFLWAKLGDCSHFLWRSRWLRLQPFFYDRESQEDHGCLWKFCTGEEDGVFLGVSLYDFFDWELCGRGYSFHLPHPILRPSGHLVCFPCSDPLSLLSGDSICSKGYLVTFKQFDQSRLGQKS